MNWAKQQASFERWLLGRGIDFRARTGYVFVSVPDRAGERDPNGELYDETLEFRFADHPYPPGGGYGGPMVGRHGEPDFSVHPGGNTLREIERAVKKYLRIGDLLRFQGPNGSTFAN